MQSGIWIARGMMQGGLAARHAPTQPGDLHDTSLEAQAPA